MGIFLANSSIKVPIAFLIEGKFMLGRVLPPAPTAKTVA